MSNSDYDYKNQMAINQKVMAVKDRNCPDCGKRLILLPPDRVWCESSDCKYAELHLIGDGVVGLESECTGLIAI